MTDLERRALLGDKQAQKECTEKGIVLPCPFCGLEAEIYTRYDCLEKYVNFKREIPNNAKIIYEKKYPNQPKYYVYRELVYIPRCTSTSCIGRNSRKFESRNEAIEAWNTRHVPPVRRCGDCKNVCNVGDNIVTCDIFERDMMPDDFCSQFEPRCEE